MGIENVTLTASGLTLNLSNQTEGFKIIGSSGADIIIGGSGADTINGQGGADSFTGNGGADQFRLTTNAGGIKTITDYVDNTDKIGFLDTGSTGSGSVNLGNTLGSTAGTALNAANLTTRASISAIDSPNDDNQVIVITGAPNHNPNNRRHRFRYGHARQSPIVFNSTTGRGEIWFDDNWETTAGRVQVATLDNVTTLAGVTNITATDIVVYSSAADPIVLDLGAPGISLTSLTHGVQFDINADGMLDQIAWTSGSDGMLAYDLDGSGKIDDRPGAVHARLRRRVVRRRARRAGLARLQSRWRNRCARRRLRQAGGLAGCQP